MVKFYLDKKNSDEDPILMSLHFQGKRYKLYTGKKIDPKKWDKKAGRANPRKYKNNPIGFNKFLQELSDTVQSLVNNNEAICKADLKELVDKANGKTSTETFFGFAESHINKQIEKGNLGLPASRGYKVTLNHIRAVSPNLTFNQVDLNFYDRFSSYLHTTKELAPNSIGGHIKRLKWIMSAALDRNLHNNIAFKKDAFKTVREDTDQIYLTKAEIKKLEKKDMPERLRKVADAFVINCHLGMRYSDLVQIRKNNFYIVNDLYHLTMVQGKTDIKINIPVPTEIMPLLRSYDFNCPVARNGRLMSGQRFNDYLKEAAELAGINSLEDVRQKGVVNKLPKYSLIKSHTARRSFSTNLYLDGVAVQDIMAITGHKKEDTFLLYVRANQLTKSMGLANHYKKKIA